MIPKKKSHRGSPITCYVCHRPGGTLVKDSKGYRHEDRKLCRLVGK